MRKSLAWVMAMILIVASTPAPLLAHGRLKSSTPAAGAHLGQAPTQLRLDFSESPDLTFTSLRLLLASGREIALGPVGYAADSHRAIISAVTGAMDAGTYVVIWQMASDDGHPVRGRIEFVVAPGAMGTTAAPGEMAGMHHDPVSMPESGDFGADSPLYVAVRWAEFAALLLLIGAVSFHYFVLGTLRHVASVPRTDGMPGFLADSDAGAASIGYVAVGLLAVTLLVRLAAQSVAMHGMSGALDGAMVSAMVRSTMWGWGWLLQLAGVGLAGAAFHRIRARAVLASSQPLSSDRARWWLLAACGALAAAYSPALASHAAASPKLRALAIVADGLHIIGASSWLGTLTVMLVAGVTAARRQAPEASGPLVRSLVNAFSPVALVSAGVAATTGVFAAWLHVGTIPNLWGTRYGLTLLLKLAILGVVTLTGFYNWRFVQPRLGTAEATTKLQRSARVEVAVAILVLLVTAVLVASPTSMDAVM